MSYLQSTWGALLRQARPLTSWAAALLAIVLFGCGPADQSQGGQEVLETDTSLARDAAAIERIVYALPSAPQALVLLKQAGATYTPKLLNPHANQSRYQSSDKAALNIGVYSTDLAITTTFNQNQESVNYFVAIQKLSDRIGVASAFDETVITRLDRNRANSDSVSSIVTRAFELSSRQLKKFGQEDVARLILVGGWVEGLYAANEFYASKPTPALAERIAEQKLVLDNLLGMIAADSARPNFALVYRPLRELQQTFAPISIEYSFEGVSTDQKRRLTRIDNKSEVKVTPEQLATLRKQTAALRQRIVE
jgi:hypothetical protein